MNGEGGYLQRHSDAQIYSKQMDPVRLWFGDKRRVACGPAGYRWEWDGLNCTPHLNESPRIIALNLSSSGFTGAIDPFFSHLTVLEKLDLSNNDLNGQVPEFLSQLRNLKILNLAGNNLGGSLPSTLLEKSNEVEKTPKEIKQDHDVSLKFKNKIYSYSDILKITNNFCQILGKGGFGTVYMGYVDDAPVAVKMLSQSSVQEKRTINWTIVYSAMAYVSQSSNERPIMSEVLIELKNALAMELSRIKYGGGGNKSNGDSSVELVFVNVQNEELDCLG
ncbi:putative leucine-rich repeat receptor-like protein kinase At2g19210 [Arachis duranensis]|uniref:Leucine-rich repeat receptor-like protein kinase At2g19210 n=1 Tax=Arachis duranensis TaxID=130453 RepID=A0A9C6T0H3_ARADU|nr:putative leucine-rich repeat receptor-like protein kinase At2g19210 [Arachis duranensis]